MTTSLHTTTGSSHSPTRLTKAAERYEFRALVKHGRTGSTYGALDRLAENLVSVKLLPFDLRASNARETFQEKIKRLTAIDDPRLAPVIDYGYHYGLAFLVTSEVDGYSLDRYLRRGPLSFEQFAPIFCELLLALETLHEHDIVHGDVQPSQISLEAKGGKVSRLVLSGPGFPDLTNGGEIEAQDTRHVSNMDAIAPERILRQTIDHRLDLYAAGATAYELLAGRAAFEGRSFGEVFKAVYEDAAPLGTVLPAGHSVPDSVLELIAALLQKSPMDRPATARDARFWLESACEDVELDLPAAAIPALTRKELEKLDRDDDIRAAKPQLFAALQLPGHAGTAPVPGPVSGSQPGSSLSTTQMLQVLALITVFFGFMAAGWMAIAGSPEDRAPQESPPVATQEVPRDDVRTYSALFTQIDRALNTGRWGEAEDMLVQLDQNEDLPPGQRGTLKAYQSRLELLSEMDRARRLEASGKLEEALPIYWKLSKKFPEHADVPESVELLETSFVLHVNANVKSTIYVDGEPIGVTPFTGVVASDAKEVSVSRKGYATWLRSIAAQPGTRLELDAKLRKQVSSSARRKRSTRSNVDVDQSPFMDLMEMTIDE